jgi:serine protease Do
MWYRSKNADLPTRLVQFFNIQAAAAATEGSPVFAKSIGHFVGATPDLLPEEIPEIHIVCEKLCRLGVLTPGGSDPNNLPMLGAAYFSGVHANMEWQRHEHYGIFDHIAFGFPFIRERFSKSVFPVVVQTDGGEDIGSSFLLEDNVKTWDLVNRNVLVTARHCIENGSFSIPGLDLTGADDLEIYFHSQDWIDIALLRSTSFSENCARGLRVSSGKVLDEVLVMGYPPIPGFDAVQIAEVATLAAQKSTLGQIAASEGSYLGKQEYHLISARTKGGSSGGPVVNVSGLLVGIVTDHPANEEGALDRLGMGLASRSEYVHQMLNQPEHYCRKLEYQTSQAGIRVLR